MQTTLPLTRRALRRLRPALGAVPLFLLGLLPWTSQAQIQTPTTITPISLTALGTAYTQDFNTLASTATGTTSSVLPNGFGFVETNAGTGTSANNLYTVSTVVLDAMGAPTSIPSGTGDTYSYGNSVTPTDRAFGSVQSGTHTSSFGFAFTNNTGATITTLTLSFFGEVYRTGNNGRNDRYDFQYSTSATSLAAGTYVDVDPLDIVGPNAPVSSSTAYDGNATANRIPVTGAITGLSIADGSTFYIRFVDFNASGSDDGIGLDDFSLTPTGAGSTCNAAFSYGTTTTFCSTGTTNPTATITGTTGGAFSVAPTTGLTVNATTGAVTLAGATAGTYTVTYTVSPTCSSTQTLTITNPQSASFNYGTSLSFCQSQTTAQAPVLSMGAVAGTFSASPAGLTLNTTTGAITPSTSTVGTYTVTNTLPAANGCAAVTSTSTVTITAPQSASFTYPTGTICAGQTATVNPSPATGATLGTFTVSPTTGLTISAAGVINPATSTAGTYTVTNTLPAAGGCAAQTATQTVTITPRASSAFSYSGSTFCLSGTNPTPTITGATGGTFSVAPTTGLTVNATTGVITLSGATSGTYTVTYTVAGTCGSSSTQSVTITSAPSATFNYGGTSFCTSGTNPTLTFGTGASAGTFTVSPATGLSINASTGAINLATSNAGTYTVTNSIAASGGCSAATATQTVTIVTPQVATFTYPTGTICAGQTATVSPSAGTGATLGTFTVSPATGLTISAAGVINPATSTAGTYTVTNTLPAANGCAAVTSTQTVTIAPATSAAFSYGTTSSFCRTSTTNPTATITGTAGGTFTVAPATGLTINATTGAITLSSSTAGTYTVTYTVAGACGSSSTQTVTITNPGVATFSYPTAPICAGQTATVSPTPATGATLGAFTVSPAVGLSINATTGVITPATSTPGTYTVTNTVAASGACAAVTATASVTISAAAVTAFTYSATANYCVGSTASIVPVVNGQTGGGTYSVTPATGLTVNATTGALSLAGATAGTYTVTYAVTGACPGSSTQSVTINAAPTTAPTVTQSGTPATGITLTAAGAPAGGSYQFYLGGMLVTGTTGNTYLVNSGTKNGSYTVTYTNASGCTSPASAATTVTVTGTGVAAAQTSLRLYPNPTPSGQLNVELLGSQGATELSVLNPLGQVVYHTALPAGTRSTTLELSALPVGVYSLQARSAQGTSVQRFVRQ